MAQLAQVIGGGLLIALLLFGTVKAIRAMWPSETTRIPRARKKKDEKDE